ncbi:ArsR/SmtB family transcription factor [Sphingomicrobium marinum]|uniref:ArsR/SmtB family transcription factor n=1 Tax=Sphingomicrobium marinum TaxID=1227950 RepID=UPI002240C314|nr:metalloregulator ArsR/SmtB family transcription factor [Sphingomicrobium marinum]
MTGDLPLTHRFQALGDATRLRILMLVAQVELTVGEIAHVLGQSQPSISRHVRILDEAGLVRRRREGAWVFVEPARDTADYLLSGLIAGTATADDEAVFAADASRLAAVQRERAEAAAIYFAERAEQWDTLRQLHVSETDVEAAMEGLVGSRPIGRLVDIGTGTGRMLEIFAPRASDAIGIDRSPEMLRLARVKLDEAGVTGASLRQGDMFALPLPDDHADTVILHLVLHFAATPGQVIAEAARILRPGGQLLIADFAPHEREELRRQLKHQRLGFADDAMQRWFSAANLEGEAPLCLDGGELSVNLWRATYPPISRSEAA